MNIDPKNKNRSHLKICLKCSRKTTFALNNAFNSLVEYIVKILNLSVTLSKKCKDSDIMLIDSSVYTHYERNGGREELEKSIVMFVDKPNKFIRDIKCIKNVKLILLYTELYSDYFVKHNIKNVHYCPLFFWHSDIPTPLSFTNKQEDIDILFYGARSEYRSKILDELSKVSNVVTHEFDKPSSLEELLKRAKIVLQIYTSGDKVKCFDVARILPALSRRKFVICESSIDGKICDLFSDKLIVCDYGKLVDTCLLWLRDDKECERNAIADRAYNYMRNVFNYEQYSRIDGIREMINKG